jgi:AraC family ethanolamine operon transcriptional activator
MSELQISTVRVESIEDVTRVLVGADERTVPLGSGTARGMILHASAGDVVLNAGKWSGDIRARGCVTTDRNRIWLSAKLDAQSTLFSFRSGRDVPPGDVYTLAHGDEVDFRVTGAFNYAFVSLNVDRLIEQGGHDAQRGDVAPWEWRRWFCPSEPVRTAITSSLRRIVAQLSRSGSPIVGPALRQLQCDLIEPFLVGMLAAEPESKTRRTLSGAMIVRKVEGWVDGQSPAAVQIADLSRALHLSRRTLQRAFTETLGLGPARYLTLKRLSAVRAELRRADPGATSVTETATKYGFWELGRFAQDYKRTFGEKPSETLSKAG